MRCSYIKPLTGFGSAATVHIRIALATIVLVMAPLERAAASPDKTWPCIQRKVPELSPGAIWAGPEIKLDSQAWNKDRAVAQLVAATISRRRSIDDAKKLLDDFAAKLKADKARRLALVFTGQFQSINAERKTVMSGIVRYARRQEALSKAIKAKLVERNHLVASKPMSAAVQKKLDDLDEKLKWDTRIFDERQQSLRYVCEVPVLLEKRLFALGRHIMSLLPQ